MTTAEAPVVADLEFALDQVDILGRSMGVTKMGVKRCLQWRLRVVLIDSCLDWLRQQCYLAISGQVTTSWASSKAVTLTATWKLQETKWLILKQHSATVLFTFTSGQACGVSDFSLKRDSTTALKASEPECSSHSKPCQLWHKVHAT